MSILLRAIPPLLQRGTLRLPADVCAKVRWLHPYGTECHSFPTLWA